MLYKKLNKAVVEKDVENAYREAIQVEVPEASITSPHNTDGFAEWCYENAAEQDVSVRLLLETKYDLELKQRLPVCTTIGQCLFYLKKFESAGAPLPNVILIADKNECLVLSSNAVKGFLDLPVKWSNAPSKGDPALTRALVDGINILPYIYDVDRKFDFADVVDKIETLASGAQHTVRATTANMGAIFTYWRDNVFRDKKLSSTDMVDVFLQCLFKPDDVYPHPKRKGVLVVGGEIGKVLINTDQYNSFFAQFQQGYKPSEIEEFYATKDRLIEDDERRRQGAFFTPDIWVEEAHKSLTKVLGQNWKEECIVWDPCCGTANLTRNYKFTDLILSTAEAADIRVIEEQGYNRGAAVFQYDFLNPEVESPLFGISEDDNCIPSDVLSRLQMAAQAGKRLVFLLNPPYAEDGVAGAKGKTRAGVAASSVVADACRKAKFRRVSRQLYAQFMYQTSTLARQYGFETHTVALFSKPTFMSSGSYRKFRDWWYGRYEAKAAFLFQASHFADVSGAWGISFSVWNSPGKTDPKAAVPCTLKDEPKGTFAVAGIGSKAIYNADDRAASTWVGKSGSSKIDTPKFSSGLKVRDNGTTYTAGSVPGTLGVMCNKGNNLMESGSNVYFITGKPTHKGCRHFDLLPANFRRAIALYGARKLVAGNWINDKDEYLAPVSKATEADVWCQDYEAYEQFVDDCHVYAIFHNSNNCTAMRGVAYKGKDWQIPNHFFWRLRAPTLEDLDRADTPDLYRDCKEHPCGYVVPKDPVLLGNNSEPWEEAGDPYMAHLLASGTLNLSDEAKLVLTCLNALWDMALSYREDFAAARPELHLTAWDAGCYQLKHLWREMFPDHWKELQLAFKRLSDKLRPGVYEHGFLLK